MAVGLGLLNAFGEALEKSETGEAWIGRQVPKEPMTLCACAGVRRQSGTAGISVSLNWEKHPMTNNQQQFIRGMQWTR